MAAHASLWLVVCGIMMLSVGLPHASSHPTPDDNQNQEVMSYYPPAQEQQQHYYPSYDYEEEDDEKKNLQDYEPVLAEKEVDEDTRYLNSRLIDAAIILGYIYFLYHVFRPEDYFPFNKRQLNDAEYTFSYNNNVTNGIMSDAFTLVMNSVDPVEMGLNLLKVDAEECRHRLVCEARHMVAAVPFLDSLAQQHGWLLGTVPSYQDALLEGRSRGECGEKFHQCPSTQLTRFLNFL